MYDDKKLAAILKEKGVKYSAISSAIGVSEETLRRKRKGRTEWTVDEAFAISQYLCLSDSERLDIFFSCV